jgi:vacuolar protein sorting-associated protein 54
MAFMVCTNITTGIRPLIRIIAISTVLNNPHKRQAPPKAHSALPPVVPADLPRVRRKDFDSYLGAIAPEWERFEYNTQLGREGVAQVAESSSTPRASLDDSQNTIHTSPIQPKSIPPLDSVPPIFFQSKFNLGDPRTFNAVTDSSDSEISDPLALPLLEKFSHYADTVEQHLILEISRRSTSFFAALTNLHELQSESEQCLARIARLRSLLTNLDDNSAKRGLQVVRREATAVNLAKVTETVKMVSGVVEMGKVARGLVGAGQWGEALGIIEEMDRLWEGPVQQEVDKSLVKPRMSSLPQVQEESGHEKDDEQETEPPDEQHRLNHGNRRRSTMTSLIPLSSLHAYASLPESLRVLTLEIAASLSSELVTVLRADLVERISQGRNRFEGVEGGVESDQGLRDRLKPLLQGLVRTMGLKEGLLSWREAVLSEVRGVVKAVCTYISVSYFAWY